MKVQSALAGAKWIWHFPLAAVWTFVFLIGVVLPFSVTPGQPANSQGIGNLRIYNQNRSQFSEWQRNDAIKFSLDQIDSSIGYLFVAAAALLGFIVKVLIEPYRDNKDQSANSEVLSHVTPGIELMLRHCAIGCVLSIVCGFVARLYFSRLGDVATFSIYDEVGFATLGQMLGFVVAAVLILIAAFSFLHARKAS